MPKTTSTALIRAIALSCIWAALAYPVGAQEKITFDDHVKPILRQRCASCHNPNKKSADLDVTNFTNLMQGGAGGEAIVPGDFQESYLYTVVSHEEEPFMPPSGSKIPENEIELIKNWINAGALESQSSVAKISKPAFDLAAGANPNVRPESTPLPPRLAIEPELVTQRPSNPTAIAVNPWSPVAAVASSKQILLYNTANLSLLGILPYPEGQIYQLKFSRNGSLLIAGGGRDGASGNVVGWNFRTGDRIFEIGDEIDAVMAADISTDHTMIALGGSSKLIRVYSTQDNSLIYEIKKHTDWISSIEFSPDGVLLATADRNGGTFVWEAETGNEYLTLGGHSQRVSDLSWRVDGNILATTSEDASTKLWEMENGQQVKTWNSHDGGNTSIEFTRDGQILTAGRDRNIKLWAQDGKMVKQFAGLSDIAISCAYCDETANVLGGDWGGQLRVWKGPDATVLGSLITNPPKLASRLADSQSYQNQLKTQLNEMETGHQKVGAKLAEVQKSLDTNNKSLQSTQTEMTNTQQALEAANQKRNATDAQAQKIQNDMQAKSQSLPMLNEALSKTNEAIQKLPDDQEIQQAFDLLTAKTQSINNEITQYQSKLKQSAEEIQVATSQVTELTNQLSQHQSKTEEMTRQISELEKQKLPLGVKYSKTQTQLDQLRSKLADAEKSAVRWQNEIDFSNHLRQLKKELAEAEQQYLVESVNVSNANEKLREAQSASENAKALQSNAGQAMKAIQEKIEQAKKINQ